MIEFQMGVFLEHRGWVLDKKIVGYPLEKSLGS